MPDSTAKPPPDARLYGLVPCAGTGSRAGAGQPKQYFMLAGRALVLHTLAALARVPRISLTLVAVAPGDTNLVLPPGRFVAADCGGPTRAQTVRRALEMLARHGARDEDWVLVHDAARCLVTPELIDRLIDACVEDPVGGLLAHPVADTLKQEEGGRAATTVPRTGLWQAQTPQMFRIGLLAQALRDATEDVTDEASAMEARGHRPLLVPGAARNFKVTFPEDFPLAEAILRSTQI